MALMSSRASTPRSGYANERSPGALAASLLLNGGILTLFVALPATHYLLPPTTPTDVRFVPLQPPPPTQPVEAKPSVRDKAEPVTAETQRQDPVAIPSIVDLGYGTQLDTMKESIDPPKVAFDPPPPTPVFVKAQPDPRYAEAFRPAYPAAMRREGLEGSVTLRVSIDERGRVSSVEQIAATHPAFFEEARRQALRYWRFRPATRDGVAVPSEQQLTVRFQMED